MDTIGLLLTVLVTAAGIQDRDAAKPLLWNLRKSFPKEPPRHALIQSARNGPMGYTTEFDGSVQAIFIISCFRPAAAP